MNSWSDAAYSARLRSDPDRPAVNIALHRRCCLVHGLEDDAGLRSCAGTIEGT